MAAGAKRKTGTEPAAIHQLKVTLQGIRPPIWRRLQVRSDTTLARLHAILQVAMGWEEEHLHQFRVGETVYGDREILQEFDVRSERTARLGQVVPEPKDRFFYDYDFGDSWEHLIVVEAVKPAEPDVHYPTCVTGKRAGPPEDCGGIWGYANFLEAIANPKHPDHADLLEWIGGSFDPEEFEPDEVNHWLARMH